MGTRIESVATAARHRLRLGHGGLRLSDEAAKACLRRGHHHAGELDILVNAGLYKERNIAEPALASIIQEDIGANPGSPPRLDRHGTFSFDVLNGGCGVVTAAQLVDGFVASGAARLGMVVAADADPQPRSSRGFPFSPAGGALLLAHDGDGTGFMGFELRTFPEDLGAFEVAVRWVPHAGVTRRGLNVLQVHEAGDFAPKCISHSIDVAGAFLARHGLHPNDVDVLVGSQYPRGFATEVALGLGIPDERVPKVRKDLAAAHTSGPIAALEAAMQSGQFQAARHVLFVTAGAGITIGVALYRC
jgi:3-oxoacyl-[acyl-carrier-protein] synthase-3